MSAPKQDAKADLLPCPFCGGEARMNSPMGQWVGEGKGINGGSYGPDQRRVVCAGLYEDPVRRCASWTIHPDEAEAIVAWNRRASPKGCDVELREAVAQWLCEEVEWPDPYVGAAWPLHEKDDGYRGNGGHVRLQPKDIVERFREIAERMVQRFALINQARQPEGGGERSGDEHPCYGEHQPGCDCVFPEQVAVAIPSYLDRLTTDNADGLSDDRAVAFLGHLIQRNGHDSIFIPAGQPIPLVNSCQVTPVYDGPQNVTRPPAGKDLVGEVERLRAALPAEADAIKGLTQNQQELLAYVAWALEEEQTVNDDHIVALLDALKDRAFLVSDLAGELHRVSTYLEVWMHDHPEDATTEFSAAIFCAKRLLARQALAALGEGE